MSDAYKSIPFRREAERLLRCAVCAVALGPMLGACSFAIPALTASAPEDTTGSIVPAAAADRLFPELGPEETRRTRAALAVALDPQGNGQPVKWDNPESGLRGEIAPNGSPFVEADEVCRNFTTTLEGGSGAARTAAGHACRLSGEDWILRTLRPVRRS